MLFRSSIVAGLVFATTAVACGGGGGRPDGGGGTGGLGGTGGTGGDDPNFPVNEPAAAAITAMGVPADAARFIAASRLEISSPDGKTYVLKQTFPNGAVRNATLTFTPDQMYAPTAEEAAAVAAGAPAVYDKHYTSSAGPAATIKTDLRYFIPTAGIPPSVVARFPSSTPLPFTDDELLADGESGAGAAWSETAAAGADVGIGSVIDYAVSHGIPVQSLAVIYAFASALSSLSTATDISRQTDPLFRELAELENCAAHPTNQVARSDPNYVPTTVGIVQSARSELQEVTGVRFLNVMTQTLSGLTPASAVVGAALTSGFSSNDATLRDYTNGTIMREARAAVVACDDPGSLRGNIDVLMTCDSTLGSQTDHETWHTVSSVGWVWNPAAQQYHSVGTTMYEHVHTTMSATGTCTLTETCTGDLTNQGAIAVIPDQAAAQILGYGYVGGGNANVYGTRVTTCPANSGPFDDMIEWLPTIMGFPGVGGQIEGMKTEPYCVGTGSSGTKVWTWSFALPPMPMP